MLHSNVDRLPFSRKNAIQQGYKNKLENNVCRYTNYNCCNDARVNFTGIRSDIGRSLHHIYDELALYPSLTKTKLSKYDDEEVLEARQQQALMQLHLINKFGVISTDQLKNREKLRDNIAEILIQNGKSVPEGKKPEAVFVVGIPGAGKTSILEGLTKQNQKDYVSLDVDEPGHYLPEYKEFFPENHKEKFYYLLFLESQDIINRAVDKAIDRKYNMIIHDPGLDYRELKNKAARLKKSGYDVHLKFMNIEADEAVKRCMDRYRHGGRFTDVMIHAKLGNHPSENYKRLTGHHPELFSSWEMYSNNVKPGEPPVLLEKHDAAR